MSAPENRDAARGFRWQWMGGNGRIPRRVLWLPAIISRRTLRDWMLAADVEASAGDEARERATRIAAAARKLVGAWDRLGDARVGNKQQAIVRRSEAIEELRTLVEHRG